MTKRDLTVVEFGHDSRTARDILVELIGHTATDYLDAHFPKSWDEQRIADEILHRHGLETP